MLHGVVLPRKHSTPSRLQRLLAGGCADTPGKFQRIFVYDRTTKPIVAPSECDEGYFVHVLGGSHHADDEFDG